MTADTLAEAAMPASIQKKVRKTTESADALLARAERSVAGLAERFLEWSRRECDRLDRLCRDALDARLRAVNLAAAHEIARELRSQAGTFGYFGLTEIAGSLEVITAPREQPAPDEAAALLARLHVQALRAVLREPPRPADDPVIHELIAGLERTAAKLAEHRLHSG